MANVKVTETVLSDANQASMATRISMQDGCVEIDSNIVAAIAAAVTAFNENGDQKTRYHIRCVKRVAQKTYSSWVMAGRLERHNSRI